MAYRLGMAAVPDGAPLLRGGRIQAAVRDASWYRSPGMAWAHHVVVARAGGAVPVCDQWVPLVDERSQDASEVHGARSL